ncbi:MAG: hypothetical protein AABX54_02510 [Nanoarchaeota archaeon]
MKISELRSGQGNVEVEGTLKDIGDTRSFNKYGRELRVANAILFDESGAVKLTLWNDDVTRFKNGDKIKIINGYVSEFQGEKQLTSGKFGRMEKISENVTKNSDSESADEESSSEKTSEKEEEEIEEVLEESEEEI